MGRQRREDGGGGAEDLNLPAARSQDGPPLALGVDTMRSLLVNLPWPLPRLVFSLRLEAWRFLSPWVPQSTLEAKEPASCLRGQASRGLPAMPRAAATQPLGGVGMAAPGGVPSLEAGPGALLRATHSSDRTYGSRMTMGGVGGRSLPSAMICSKVMSV